MAAPTNKFMFATGIENSYPTIAGRNGRSVRVDEMAKCDHYRRWREDFELVKELGVSFLRYGPPYYRTHLGPARYDWEFADETFGALEKMEIKPIVDLCHFGVPDWIGGFDNPDWPKLFAEYARDFALRYPGLRGYTPVNEIFVAAQFSGLFGWWNERQSSDRGFVTALKHMCEANLRAMEAILEVKPDAVFVQSESSEYFHAKNPSCILRAQELNERRFLSLDLAYGHPVNDLTYEYLLDNGFTREEFRWFRQHHARALRVMGNDYYITNEHLVENDGAISASGEVFGYYVITHQYYKRYRLPVMHTETNLADAEHAPAWLRKEWANVHRLRQDDVPIIGFTWYSLTDQVDWDTALREDNGRVNPLGLYDLDRKIRPVGKAYKELIAAWDPVLPKDVMGLVIPQIDPRPLGAWEDAVQNELGAAAPD